MLERSNSRVSRVEAAGRIPAGVLAAAYRISVNSARLPRCSGAEPDRTRQRPGLGAAVGLERSERGVADPGGCRVGLPDPGPGLGHGVDGGQGHDRTLERLGFVMPPGLPRWRQRGRRDSRRRGWRGTSQGLVSRRNAQPGRRAEHSTDVLPPDPPARPRARGAAQRAAGVWRGRRRELLGEW